MNSSPILGEILLPDLDDSKLPLQTDASCADDNMRFQQDVDPCCDPNNPRYKTEMCRNFKERSKCIYGDNCQFAHGKRELREVVRNNKYKTKLCQKYWIAGYCVYGPRCNFLHDEVVHKRLN